MIRQLRRVRFLLDDSRDIVQMFNLIETIASGARRLSEIASRMGKLHITAIKSQVPWLILCIL